MIPDMSSDRVNAYRVFKGEIEKLLFVKGDKLTGIEILVIDYMKQRMNEMKEKGHDYASSTRYDIAEYQTTSLEEENYSDSDGRRKTKEIAP